MNVPDIVIRPNELSINGIRFTGEDEPREYYSLLGKPAAIDDGPTKAPIGHRNNQLHAFASGIYLNEHHARRKISCVSIVYEPHHCVVLRKRPVGIRYGFRGTACIGAVEVSVNEMINELVTRLEWPFRPHLGYMWFHDGDVVSINIETFSERKQSKDRKVSAIHCGFMEARRVQTRE